MGNFLCKASRGAKANSSGHRKRAAGRDDHEHRILAKRPRPAAAAPDLCYLRGLHSSRAYRELNVIQQGESRGYYYELSRLDSPSSASLSQTLASIQCSPCLLDLNWRPRRPHSNEIDEQQISLGGLLITLISRLMHNSVRCHSRHQNATQEAIALAGRLADEIERGGVDLEQPGDDSHLVTHLGGLLHPKLHPDIKRLADAVLRRAEDVNVKSARGATLMMICAEDCFLYGENLFVVLNGLHQTHGCDWNVQDKLGNTPMHEIVDSGDADCLFRLLELQLPGVDCYVRNNKGETFMALAHSCTHRRPTEGLRDDELVSELCTDWVLHWQSVIRTALQPHLPVESDSALVLVDLVLEYIDGTGTEFIDTDKQAAIDAELEEMMQGPVRMPPDFSEAEQQN